MTEPINRLVLDLSHHNTVTSWAEVVRTGIVGIIHKASEGTYMTDDEYGTRRVSAMNEGLLWGAYHFATNNNVAEQVDLFIRYATPSEYDLIVLDWEPYGDKTMTKDQARQWIELVEDRLNRPGEVVIYSGNLAKEKLGPNDTFFGERRLWLAHYSSSPKVEPPWSDYWLWQYSDGQAGPSPKGCPGVSGFVDTNSYQGSKEQLEQEWASGKREPLDSIYPTLKLSVEGGYRLEIEQSSSQSVSIIILPE